MVKLEDIDSNLLRGPSKKDDDAPPPLTRARSVYHPLHTFALDRNRQYQQQFGDMYFLRLTKIKPAVEAVAAEAWAGTVIGGAEARQVDRVLDVRQGELCWVAGTVYMDMPLKPNILEDVSRDRWISAPSAVDKYYADDGSDAIMLEDDSGRVRLVGDLLKSIVLVTGCIIAVMGTENANGEFDVLDIRLPDLPPQPERWALSKPESDHQPGTKGKGKKKEGKDEDEDEDVEMSEDKGSRGSSSSSSSKIAIVSGLEFSGTDTSYAAELNLLLEYLLGEALDPTAQGEIAHISRLIIAGNSIAASATADEKAKLTLEESETKSHKKYGYDASAYNPVPSQLLDAFLAELLPSMPVTLLPGALDPANASYPQQPIHTAMFPRARTYSAVPKAAAAAAKTATTKSASTETATTVTTPEEPGWFDPVTNPWEGEVDGWRIVGTGGQNVDDVFKYVGGDDRLSMMEAMCRWRCLAPTAPDTLWAYPFQEDEPFVLKTCPHLYFVGCQPRFGTRLIDGPRGEAVRLVAVPSFAASREIVLVDSETLEVERVRIVA